MARVKDQIAVIQELIEQGYPVEYIAGYTGCPIAWVEVFKEGKREMEALYNEGSR